jgi:hypothetical protein
MKVHIEILDDKDEVVFEQTGDASQPLQWRTTSEQKFISPMPSQSDQAPTGTYELFGFTFQPIVRVDRPNGYTPATQSPLPGQQNLPTNFPQPLLPGFGYGQQKSWGTSAPTPQSTNPTFLGATPTQRG